VSEMKFERYMHKLDSLPSFSPVITKVMALAIDESDAKEMSAIIEKDTSLSAKILRVVNSPFFGLSRNISTLSRAIAILGLKVVKNLVLSLSLLKAFSGKNKEGFDYNLFWEHSLAVAAGGRLISEKCGYRDPEEAFMAGLLHDIGVLIFANLEPRLYKEVLSEIEMKVAENKEYDTIEIENRIMNDNHAEVGAWLVQKWNLPEILELVIRYHHSVEYPSDMPAAVAKLIRCIYLANKMWNVFYLADKQAEIMKFRQLCYGLMGLKDDDVKEIITKVTEEAQEAAGVFLKIPMGETSYLETLERANVELGKMNLSYLFMTEMLQGSRGEQRKTEEEDL